MRQIWGEKVQFIYQWWMSNINITTCSSLFALILYGKKIYEISRERCNGCEIDHLSQSEHSCLMDSSYMKLVMNFELAFMNLNIRVFHSMLRDHDCDRAEIITLSEIMKTHCLTDFWYKLYSGMKKDTTSYDYWNNEWSRKNTVFGKLLL